MKVAEFAIAKLPTIPSVLVRLIEACHKPDICFDELSQIIRQDAALSARIIAIGSSAAYAQWQGQRSFEQLLVVLGLETIKTIAITAAVQQFFSQFQADCGSRIGGLWRQSLGCAHMARKLARLTGLDHPDEAYLTGLLHNLGQLIYLQRFGDRYAPLLDETLADDERDRQETDNFGAISTRISAHLVQQWLPGSFAGDAVLFQREPATALYDSPPLVKIINLSHKLTQGRMSRQHLLEEGDRLFGLNADILDDLTRQVAQELQQILSSYGFEPDDRQPATDSEQARMALGGHVRNAAMTRGIESDISDDSPWETLLRNFTIVFGLPSLLCFEYDPAHNRLHGRVACGIQVDDAQLRQLSLPLETGRNLLSEAGTTRTTLASTDPDLPAFSTVLGQQLSRLLGRPELVALPLTTTSGELLGVLAVGMAAEAVPDFLQQRTLIDQFLAVSVNQLKQSRDRLQDKSALLEVQADDFHAESRRLVHEASNPLGVIKNYLQILSMQLDQDSETQGQIGIIRDEIDRVSDILLRMRDIGSEAQVADSSVDLNVLIRNIVSIFQASLFVTHHIDCNLRLDPDLAPISTNRNSLKQILNNLLKNAVEALEDGGTVTVETQDKVNLNGVPHVRIIVADNGAGLPGAILENIFTPVTSTKGPQHSGLGLVIVRNLVTALHGSIFVHSTEDTGTRFEILIPRG